MRRKKNLKKFVAFLLSVIMLLSLCTTVFAEVSDSSDGTNADPVICELTEGCILENGHEGECIVNPDVDETEYEDGETKSGVEETVPETVRKFLSAVAAIEIPEEINDETGPILNEQIGAASDAYDALSEEDLKREDVWMGKRPPLVGA